MPFSIIEGEGRTLWVPSDGSSTYYMGQIVSFTPATAANNTDGAVVPLAVPAGAADATNMQIPAGVVVGFNRRTPRYTTVGSMSLQYDTGVVLQADQVARDFTGAEGMYSKGDPQVLIQIAEILPTTILRGPICKAALGTAVGVITLTALGGTDGMVTADTANAIDCTTGAILAMGTYYCRKGANMGLYRVNKNTTSTAPSVTTAFPYDEAVGDQFVYVPLKQGNSTVYIAGPGLYIDSTKDPVSAGTTLFNVIVYKLNLAESGNEYAEFRFGGDHFCRYRA